MKRVLIVAHLLRASPRIPGLARYLPEFGWQPVIVTAPVSGADYSKLEIVETDYRETLGFWKKLFRIDPKRDDRDQLKQRLGVTSQWSLLDGAMTRIGEIANYPDSDKGWRRFAIEAGSKLVNEGGFEAIISSSSPVTAHIIAKELKLKYGIPWIADLRDLWTQNHNYHYGVMRKRIDVRLELSTLAAADALVTVSKPWVAQLVSLHTDKKAFAITNGFDPESFNSSPAPLTPKFTITYTGNIYTGKQDPARLFEALRSLISEDVISSSDIEVRFYGAEAGWLSEQVKQYGLTGIVQLHGAVSRQAALERQRESQVLLLLDWDDPSEKGVYPLKVFEYLAARRPILATGGTSDSAVASLLKETGAGFHSVTSEETKDFLRTLYAQFKAQGSVTSQADETKINRYSYREMARSFSAILEQLVAARGNSGESAR